MSKHLNSRDPRAPKIKADFKALTGATKITLAKEIGPGTFRARCMKRAQYARFFEHMGDYELSYPATRDAKPTVRLLTPPTHCEKCLGYGKMHRGVPEHASVCWGEKCAACGGSGRRTERVECEGQERGNAEYKAGDTK